MSATKFHVGDRVEDKKTHERGRVTFVYSTLELRDELIAVLFNGNEAVMSAVQDLNRSPAARASILVTSKRDEIVIAASTVTVLPYQAGSLLFCRG